MASNAPLAVSLTVGTISPLVIALLNMFVKASNLNDFDFCLYMQAVTHFYEKREFTYDDILDWFQRPNNTSCNMHDSRWQCTHLNDHDECGVLPEIKNIIRSLYDKGILEYRYKGKTKFYKLKG